MNSHCFKFHRSYSISFFVTYWPNGLGLNPKGPYLRLEKDNFCVVFTYSTESGAWNYEVSCDCRSRATTAKKCTEAWCTCRVVVLLIKTYCFFAVLVTVAVVVGLAHNCCDPAIVTWRHTSLYFNHCWFGKNSYTYD